MKVGALVTKFTPPKLGKELAYLGVSGGAGLHLALKGGAGLLCVKLLAALTEFTMAELVKFAVKPISSHFLSAFLKFLKFGLPRTILMSTCLL